MNAAKVYSSTEYLSACDLEKEVVLEIEDATLEHLKGSPSDPGKDRVCLKLKGAKKRVVLNKTNCKAICRAYGNETTAWQGKRISVRPDTCSAFGVSGVPCIRISIPKA